MTTSSIHSFDQHHSTNSERFCYVQCNFCSTVLGVSVPATSLFKTVPVRCGHCNSLLSVNMRALLPSAGQLHFSLPSSSLSYKNHLEDIPITTATPNLLVSDDQSNNEVDARPVVKKGKEQSRQPQVVNRPPEKRQRVPSVYNKFIKEEIHRIKAVNPDMPHKEAFSAAAKNWAHFPHIHYGIVSNPMKNMKSVCQQE